MHIFADETGKVGSEPIVAFAGIVSTEDRWQAFNDGWSQVMDETGITSIHTSELMSPARSYQGRGFSADQKYDLLQKCLALANTHAFMSLGSAVDCSAFKFLSKHSKDKIGGDGHVMAFTAFLHQLVSTFEVAVENGFIPKQPMALVFDDNQEYAAKCYKVFSRRRQNNPIWRDWIKSICFADDAANTPIQAADILAWLLNQHLKSHLPLHRSSLSDKQIESLLTTATRGLSGGALNYDAGAFRLLDQELKTREFYDIVKVTLKKDGNLYK